MVDGDDCGAISGMNEWQGKPKYSVETWSSAALSITDPTWLDPGSKRERSRWEVGATIRLSYGTASVCSLVAITTELHRLFVTATPLWSARFTYCLGHGSIASSRPLSVPRCCPPHSGTHPETQNGAIPNLITVEAHFSCACIWEYAPAETGRMPEGNREPERPGCTWQHNA
jgi:hypothetical protein